MASLGDLVVNLGANTSKFDKGIKGAQSRLGKFSTGIGKQVRAIGGLVGAYMGVRTVMDSVGAAQEQMAAESKLQAVLNATGNAADLSADEIKAYASELQDVTNFGDEATISAAAMLGTFKEIKGDTFKDTLAVAQDMSAVMGTDLKSSVLQLGKALNDPMQGMSALTRSGVSFTDQQKEQIKAMQKSGDLLGAQAMMLGEIQSQFGGAAEAMADPFTQVSNALGDVKEELGKVFVGLMASVKDPLLDFIKGVPGAFKTMFRTLEDIVGDAVAGGTVLWDQMGKAMEGAFQDVPKVAGAVFDWVWENTKRLFKNIMDLAKELPSILENAGKNLGEEAAFQLGLSDEKMTFDVVKDFRGTGFSAFKMPELSSETKGVLTDITDAVNAARAERQAARDAVDGIKPDPFAQFKGISGPDDDDRQSARDTKMMGVQQKDSSQAMETIIRAMQQRTDPALKVEQEQLKTQKETLTAIKGAMNGPSVNVQIQGKV